MYSIGDKTALHNRDNGPWERPDHLLYYDQKYFEIPLIPLNRSMHFFKSSGAPSLVSVDKLTSDSSAHDNSMGCLILK